MTGEKLKRKIQKNKAKKARQRKKSVKITHVVAPSLIFIVLMGTAFLLYKCGIFGMGNGGQIEEVTVAEESLDDIKTNPADECLGSSIVEHIIAAANATEEMFGKRPPEVELTEENASNFVTVSDCQIHDGKVVVTTSSEGIPRSDDKFYYLFHIKGYDDSNSLEGKEYLDKVYKNSESSLQCALNAGGTSSKLFDKFGVAVKIDGEYKLVSTPSYITNPEVLAPHNNVYMNAGSKKGILIDYNRVFTGQLEDLGVKQAAINIPIASIMGPTTNVLFPSIHYSYNGKTYTFNGVVVAGFDQTIAALTSKGIQTTAILLNSYTNAYISLIHPDARSAGVCPYYMFNGATEDGVEMCAAVGAFLADRYSGSKHGKISNWVIANEINARKEWNYLKYTDVETYSREYAKSFRVFYTAIKSISSTARVYISLDQTWDRNLEKSPDYDGKDVLDCFNNYLSSTGNIDWSLAYHPYNIPLTSCKTWASSKYVNRTASTPMISMQNIEVLVNYLNQDHYKNPSNQCRSIMITELGYTSSGGEQMQAAAIAYAYYKVAHYNDIDGLLLNRQTDDHTEIAQGLATGITTSGGGHKYSYDVYKYMDTSSWEDHMAFAKSIIGISNWNEIIK